MSIYLWLPVKRRIGLEWDDLGRLIFFLFKIYEKWAKSVHNVQKVAFKNASSFDDACFLMHVSFYNFQFQNSLFWDSYELRKIYVTHDNFFPKIWFYLKVIRKKYKEQRETEFPTKQIPCVKLDSFCFLINCRY